MTQEDEDMNPISHRDNHNNLYPSSMEFKNSVFIGNHFIIIG